MTFKTLWAKWLKIAKVIGDFQLKLLLSFVYFILLALPAVYLKVTDPLNIKKNIKKKETNFSKWIHTDNLKQAQKAY